MSSKHTFRRVVGLGFVIAAIASATAQAGGTTPQGLRADGLRLQGIAQAYGAKEGSTPAGVRADGLRWNAIAQAYRSQTRVAPVSKKFDWGDAGIGVAGGLGFAVIAVAAIVFTRHLRRARLAL